MVMGDDSCSRGCGFESRRCILDGYFSHRFVVKIVLCLKRSKINKKDAGDGHFLKKTTNLLSRYYNHVSLGGTE